MKPPDVNCKLTTREKIEIASYLMKKHSGILIRITALLLLIVIYYTVDGPEDKIHPLPLSNECVIVSDASSGDFIMTLGNCN